MKSTYTQVTTVLPWLLTSDLDNNWTDRYDVTYLAAMVNFQVRAGVASIGLEATSFVQKNSVHENMFFYVQQK